VMDNAQINDDKCRSVDSLNQLIANAKQIFITMPAKSAGASLKAFVDNCAGSTEDSFINNGDKIDDFMTSSLHLPKVIVAHSYGKRAMNRLLEHMTRDTLLVYIHCEETERLRSAIKHVTKTILCWEQNDNNIDPCEIDEQVLIQSLQNQFAEIGLGARRILTCEVFNKIDETVPKMVFLNYKQADKLQELISNHHCPELSNPVHLNTEEQREVRAKINLMNGKNSTTIEDWVEAKGKLLEWGFGFNKKGPCERRTRSMEDQLFACEDGILMT